jgi:hypothetical protein
VQGRLDARRAAPAGETRRDDPRVVEHHDIARPQQVRQVAHHAVGERGADMEQTCRVARLCRPLRDQRWRQVEVEIGDFHGRARSGSESSIHGGR